MRLRLHLRLRLRLRLRKLSDERRFFREPAEPESVFVGAVLSGERGWGDGFLLVLLLLDAASASISRSRACHMLPLLKTERE